MLTKLAVFASGNGTNFVAIADAINDGKLAAEIKVIVVDKQRAPVIEHAKQRGIPVYYLDYKAFATKELAEMALIPVLQAAGVDLIVLAGFMRIITKQLLAAYPNKIINIHPSLLPAFPGRHGIDDAFNAGVSQTGVTIHYVDSGIDSGQIIQQVVVPILPNDTLASLETKIHTAEHQVYPQAINTLINTEK